MSAYILKQKLHYNSLCYDNFCTKTDTGDKIKYNRFSKNTETQQENTKEHTKKGNWNKLGLIKNVFLINSEDLWNVVAPSSIKTWKQS